MTENNMGKRQFLVFNNTMWDCVCVQEFNLREENMRERENEREKNKKIEPFLVDLLVLKPLMISLSLSTFFFFFWCNSERVMLQTQQFSKNLNTQLMASCKKM